MYTSIRKYSIKPGCMEEVMRCIQSGFVLLIRQEPDFIDYYALQVGPNEMLTISVFGTRAGAEGATPLAFEWVHQNLERFVQGVLEATVGQVFAGAYIGAYAPASREQSLV